MWCLPSGSLKVLAGDSLLSVKGGVGTYLEVELGLGDLVHVVVNYWIVNLYS